MMRAHARLFLLILVVWGPAAGCQQTNRGPMIVTADGRALPLGNWHICESNAGTYKVLWAAPDAGLPVNEPTNLVFQIFDARNGRLVEDAVAVVDAAMPAHGHGLNSRPQVTRLSDGSFAVAGLVLHMAGHWELYFDITRGHLTERAQVVLDLE